MPIADYLKTFVAYGREPLNRDNHREIWRLRFPRHKLRYTGLPVDLAQPSPTAYYPAFFVYNIPNVNVVGITGGAILGAGLDRTILLPLPPEDTTSGIKYWIEFEQDFGWKFERGVNYPNAILYIALAEITEVGGIVQIDYKWYDNINLPSLFMKVDATNSGGAGPPSDWTYDLNMLDTGNLVLSDVPVNPALRNSAVKYKEFSVDAIVEVLIRSDGTVMIVTPELFENCL